MPLIHQFECVANAINDHESTFNIPSIIHLLLNYILIAHNVALFIQFPFCICKFISNHFSFIISITSIIYLQLYNTIFVNYVF